MKKTTTFGFLQLSSIIVIALIGCVKLSGEEYPYRLVQINMDNPEGAGEVERFREIARNASDAGYNGIVMCGMFDALDIATVYAHKNLREMRRIAGEYDLKLIPVVYNVGYNAHLLKHNRHLAEGLGAVDVPYVVKGMRAELLADNNLKAVDWGSDEHAGNAGKLEQRIAVKPRRQYRISLMVKTDGLTPSDAFGDGRFGVDAYGADGRRLTYFDPQIPRTTDWRKVVVAFNSKEYDEIVLAVGVNGDSEGKFQVAEVEIEEIGLVNVIRRPGAPLVVRNGQSGMVYTEGVDYKRVEDQLFNFLFDHDGPAIELLAGGRIGDGERLAVSYYHAAVIYQGQTPVCVSEPEVFAIWERLAPVLHDTLQTDYYFLNTDEVRIAGTCAACRARGISVGEMIGVTLKRQMEIIRKVNPNAIFMTWSDMFDPYHNANKRDGRDVYYLADESFEDSWHYLPKDLIIVNWNNRNKKESTEFFNKLGHSVIGAGYYDRDNVSRDEEWADVLDDSDKAAGYLYSTWLDKYELLDDFNELFR